jgi:hypothetical protein
VGGYATLAIAAIIAAIYELIGIPKGIAVKIDHIHHYGLSA